MAPSSIRMHVTAPTAALGSGVRQAVVRSPILAAQPVTPGNARIPLITRHCRPEHSRLVSGRPSATRQSSALFAFRSRSVFAALASEELTDQDLRVLWDTIPKPLITIGKKGIEPSHCNSLKDLLAAHKVVKVKFISDDVGAEEAESLGSGSEGVLLQQKGATMMFVMGGLGREDLMAVGASNSKRKESRAAHRSVRREQRREEPPELDPILTTALQRLVRKGKLQVGDVDNMAAWAMVDLPNDEARNAAAKRMTPQAISKVVNKSAWITSICKQAAREHTDSS